MIVLSVNAKQNVSARANINSVLMMIAFFQFIHNKKRDTKTKNNYYSRLISTPALVSPSSSSLPLMMPTLTLMMLLLGLR